MPSTTTVRAPESDVSLVWSVVGAQSTAWESIDNGVSTPVDTDYIQSGGTANTQKCTCSIPDDLGSVISARVQLRYSHSAGKSDTKTITVQLLTSGDSALTSVSSAYTDNGVTIGNEWQSLTLSTGVRDRSNWVSFRLAILGNNTVGTCEVYEAEVELTYNPKTYDGQPASSPKKITTPVSVYCWSPARSTVNGAVIPDRMGRQDGELVHSGAPNIEHTERGPVYDLDSGTSTYIRIPDNKDHIFTDGSDKPFSLCCWYKHSDFTASRLAHKLDTATANGGWEWFFTGGGLPQLLLSDGSAEANNYRRATTDYGTLGLSNQWVHLAATYDGRGGSTAYNGIALYLNGEEVDTSYTDAGSGTYGSMTNQYSDIWIGGVSRVPDYNGFQIQDFRIYSTDLSLGQVKGVYTQSRRSPQMWNRRAQLPWSSINFSAPPPASGNPWHYYAQQGGM